MCAKLFGLVFFVLVCLPTVFAQTVDLGSSLSVSSPVFLGESIELSGSVLRGLEPVFLNLDINLVNAQGETVVVQTISPDEQGLFLFSFRTSLIDKPGIWILQASGVTEQQAFSFSKPIDVQDPLRERALLVETILEKTRVQKGGSVGIVVRVSDATRLVDDALVEIVNPLGNVITVPLESLGEYAVSYTVPFELPVGSNSFLVHANRDTGILVEGTGTFELVVEQKPFSLELVLPTEKRFSIGDTVVFRVFAQYGFGDPVLDANAFVLVNQKRVELVSEGRGFFGGEFVVSPADEGSVAFEAVVVDRFSNRSSVQGQFEAFGTGLGFLVTQYGVPVLGLAVLLVLVFFGASRFFHTRTEHEKWLRRHAEILELEKSIQVAYFEKATLSRSDFLERMQKYEVERKQLEQKMLAFGITTFEKTIVPNTEESK